MELLAPAGSPEALTAAVQAGADASKVKEHAAAMIEGVPDTRIDYLEIVDAETMQPLAENRKPALMAAAVYFGDVRLIDNIEL